MKAWKVQITLGRTNPLMMRILLIAQSFTIKEFADAAYLSLGGDCKQIYFCHESGKDQTIDWKDKLDILQRGDYGWLNTVPLENSFNHPILYWLILEEGIMENPLPRVLTAYGNQLPQNITDIQTINYMQQVFELNERCSLPDGTVFYRKDMKYQADKVENALRKCFAPETARKEIQRSFATNYANILNNLTVSDLKAIADGYGVYFGSGMKKAELVNQICEKLGSRRYVKDLFGQLPLREFFSFRRLLTEESDALQTEPDPDQVLIDNMPELYARGMVAYFSKTGLWIARELLDDYEEWFDTEQEEEFIEEKYYELAVNASAALYGIFSYEMYLTMVQIVTPEDRYQKERAALYLREKAGVQGKYSLASLNQEIWYCTKEMKKKTAAELARREIFQKKIYYRPGRLDAETLGERGLFVPPELEAELLRVLSGFHYHSRYWAAITSAEDMMKEIIEHIHAGRTGEELLEIVKKEIYGIMSKEVKNALSLLLDQCCRKVPLITLGGYSREAFEQLQAEGKGPEGLL